jgi:hypothetical protein
MGVGVQGCADGGMPKPFLESRRCALSALAGTSDLKTAWGNFIDDVGQRKGGWDWYATLTFRDPSEEDILGGWTKVGMGYSKRACDGFLRLLEEMKGLNTHHWFRAREYQRDRGVPHYHLLIGGVGNLRRDEASEWWFKQFGFARILPYEEKRGARFYLCKYVTKELGDFEFSDNLVLG